MPTELLFLYTIMDCRSTRLSFKETGAFSRIALDYIDAVPALKPFYAHQPDIAGVQKAIDQRRQFNTNRELLVERLKNQYQGLELNATVKNNIDSLLSADTFTITTAHQNNIFTGPLYFIYKILHTIRLAEELKKSIPAYNFVPVFYIGSEDADLDELNHIYLDGDKLEWKTNQTGAVGRMKIDQSLISLIDRMEGRLTIEPFGKEIIDLIRKYYKKGTDLQTSTFHFVNYLFAEYGLVVLLPDNPALKSTMIPVFEDELLNQHSSSIVTKTAESITNAGYKTQAHPREINLFYLNENSRERIVNTGDKYEVLNTSLSWKKDDILKELKEHPERFSPNVILRGLFQETILPNIIFTGGGGELAYWLELKDLFTFYKVPYPILLLRNSFMIIEKKWAERIEKMGFDIKDIFQTELDLVNKLVARESEHKLKLNGTLSQTEQLYDAIRQQAGSIDSTLEKHVEALKTRSVYRLQELEKKMLRAEKRKFSDQQRHIHAMKERLFPGNGLQERIDNISYYYAKWGKEFINQLYKNSLGLEREFVVIEEVPEVPEVSGVPEVKTSP